MSLPEIFVNLFDGPEAQQQVQAYRPHTRLRTFNLATTSLRHIQKWYDRLLDIDNGVHRAHGNYYSDPQSLGLINTTGPASAVLTSAGREFLNTSQPYYHDPARAEYALNKILYYGGHTLGRHASFFLNSKRHNLNEFLRKCRPTPNTRLVLDDNRLLTMAEILSSFGLALEAFLLLDRTDLLAFAQFIGTNIDNGDFVTEFVQGLPGTRSQITKGEVEIKTEQNLGIFDSIGTEIEGGAINIAYAMYETMVLNWNSQSRPSPSRVLGENEFTYFLENASLEEKKDFLRQDCDIKIVGISAQIEMAEKAKLLMAMKAYAESPLFNAYFKPKELLHETTGAMGMYKPPFLKTDQELERDMLGQKLVEALGSVAQSGGPEVASRIQEFLQGLMQQGGGGNGGVAEGAIPAEPAPFSSA